MKTISVFFIGLLFSSIQMSGESSTVINFCGRTGTGIASNIELNAAELKECDFSLQLNDEEWKVSRFRLTIISKSDSMREIEVDGGTIPAEIREELYSDTKKFFIEYVKAKRRGSDEERMIAPVTVTIE